MEQYKKFLADFMKKLDFPEEAQCFLLKINNTLEQDEDSFKEMSLIINQFFSNEYEKFEEILNKLNQFAEKTNIHQYTIHLMFFIYCSQVLKEKYNKAGISEDVFWNSMLDLRCKLMECQKIHGIWGTFVAHWFPGFYKLQRFGLGRLQYEYYTFNEEDYTLNGYTVHKGDRVYNIHIPSSGPLTREDRMDSYKKAYEFFKNELDGKPIVFVCISWLLYPDYEKILPAKSNIVDFMHDFKIIKSVDNESFNDAWRVFGKDYKNPVEELPTDTSIQRAFVEWLKGGNKNGWGYGIIVFDGEKII